MSQKIIIDLVRKSNQATDADAVNPCKRVERCIVEMRKVIHPDDRPGNK